MSFSPLPPFAVASWIESWGKNRRHGPRPSWLVRWYPLKKIHLGPIAKGTQLEQFKVVLSSNSQLTMNEQFKVVLTHNWGRCRHNVSYVSGLKRHCWSVLTMDQGCSAQSPQAGSENPVTPCCASTSTMVRSLINRLVLQPFTKMITWGSLNGEDIRHTWKIWKSCFKGWKSNEIQSPGAFWP